VRRASTAIAAGILFVLYGDSKALALSSGEHADPIAPVLLVLIAILVVAKLGGELFERLGQPAVLGELLGGVALGNLALLNQSWNFFAPLQATGVQEPWAIVIDGLAHLGVIILLFEVGLESTVPDMLKVGASSFVVAVLGVIAPSVLGIGVSWVFIKELPEQLAALAGPGFSLWYVHIFVGTTLCATSVGITARVLKDLGKLQSQESKIILGAAVIDDVLGLIILAVVSATVTAAQTGQPLALVSILRLLFTAVVFLGGSLAIGVFFVPRVLTQLAKLRTAGVMLISSILFAFALSYLSTLAGLAPIVGAFAAGLILDEVHFRGFRDQITIEQLIRPVSTLLVPIFFVLMGIRVRLETFLDPSVIGLAAGITVVAIAGKQICGLGVLERGLDRLTVGVGMIPRGEVGLIFAGMGKSLNVIDNATYSALIAMVMGTTLIAPFLLKQTLLRWERKLRPQ
jgi:Kef-type K+ transport system membrane component KefB